MGRFTSKLQEILNQANARGQSNPNVKMTMQRFHGRSITLDVTDDERYVVVISADGLRLETPTGSAVDMYVRTDSEIVSRALRGDFSSLFGKIQATSHLFVTRRIQYQNITVDDWNAVKGFIGF